MTGVKNDCIEIANLFAESADVGNIAASVLNVSLPVKKSLQLICLNS